MGLSSRLRASWRRCGSKGCRHLARRGSNHCLCRRLSLSYTVKNECRTDHRELPHRLCARDALRRFARGRRGSHQLGRIVRLRRVACLGEPRLRSRQAPFLPPTRSAPLPACFEYFLLVVDFGPFAILECIPCQVPDSSFSRLPSQPLSARHAPFLCPRLGKVASLSTPIPVWASPFHRPRTCARSALPGWMPTRATRQGTSPKRQGVLRSSSSTTVTCMRWTIPS